MVKTTNRVGVEQDPLKLLKKRDIGVVCQYTRMTDIGRELNNLEKLYLNGNYLRHISLNIKDLSKLKVLDLGFSHYTIRGIDILRKLPNLTELSIDINDLLGEKSLYKLVKLKYLYIYCFHLNKEKMEKRLKKRLKNTFITVN